MSPEELGYAIGVILAPFVVAFFVVAAVGAWRADDRRVRVGLRYALHPRTLAVAGFFWLFSVLGRAVGG